MNTVGQLRFRRLWLAKVAFLLSFFALIPFAAAQNRKAASADAECLACHGQADLKSQTGRSVYVNEPKHQAGIHAGLNCTDCHTDVQGFPHPETVKPVQCSSCHMDEASDLQASVHAALGQNSCNSCHGPAHDIAQPNKLVPQSCTACHASESRDFRSSVHGASLQSADPQSPNCLTCHGPVHKILLAEDPASPSARKNQPATCGSCHADSAFLAKHRISFVHPVETYRESVHGHALASGNQNAAACSDCHTAHAIYASQDLRSTTNHWNIPKTCASCHSDIEKTYSLSIHGQAFARKIADAPICTDCHGDHAILAPNEPQSLINPARLSLVTCGRCHSDQRLEARYNLPADRVPTYANSYHGLAARAGSQSVANCASCHGVHNIFPSSDPRSTVNAANLVHTCGACHSGAGQAFVMGPVHVSAETDEESAAVRYIRLVYLVLIPVTIAFMFFHHSLDFWRKLRSKLRGAADRKQVLRMNLHFRIAHWLAVISFPLLVITGFALKFPEAWWARPMLLWESRFAFRGTVHRIAAIVLLASLAYHLIHLLLARRDRTFWREMLPKWSDLRDLREMLEYNLGMRDARPAFGRFSYVEKIEYLAFLWGVAIMAATGFVLWFNTAAMRHFPKWVSDAATALHLYEAILATAAIAIWHMYTVVFDPEVYPMDQAWLTGKTSAEHVRRTRPSYYAQLTTPERPQTLEPNQTPRPPASGTQD